MTLLWAMCSVISLSFSGYGSLSTLFNSIIQWVWYAFQIPPLYGFWAVQFYVLITVESRTLSRSCLTKRLSSRRNIEGGDFLGRCIALTHC